MYISWIGEILRIQKKPFIFILYVSVHINNNRTASNNIKQYIALFGDISTIAERKHVHRSILGMLSVYFL